jgi:HTH-type transcriptional repressor of NAD biosynthesis genes
MLKAFVFGKFLPFHKGHEAMIKFALSKCEFLSVLICCSNKENYSAAVRQNWIKSCFQDEERLEVLTYQYNEDELPNTSVSSKEISKIWAEVFKSIFPTHELLITSEPYGDFVAHYMNINHISFDIDRAKFPVSASMIKKDLGQYWNYLPDSVKQDLVTKIVILGTESTGKTTLSKELADYYHCGLVAETARNIIANSNNFNYTDLLKIAKEHAQNIEKSIAAHHLLIIDTDIHITNSYSKHFFNKELIVDKEIYESNRASLYLYLKNDVEYIQDGTRLNKADRDLLDISHRNNLKQHQIQTIEIFGNWLERFEKSKKYINKLIEA